MIETARKNLDISARKAENYLQKLQTETKLAEDLRVALEEEREATAMKYASLEIEASKREKERRREFEKELAETVAGFERQSKAFIEKIEDKALQTKLEKERRSRKAELNRAVTAKVQSPKSKVQNIYQEPNKISGKIADENLPIAVGAKVLTPFGNVGTVERMDKEVAEILVGGMRLREKLKNLQRIDEATEKSSGSGRSRKITKTGTNFKFTSRHRRGERGIEFDR